MSEMQIQAGAGAPLQETADEARSVRHDKPWRTGAGGAMEKPSFAGFLARYGILILLLILAVFPFIWQLSTSLKGATEDIYSFPPNLIPNDPTLDNYATVLDTIPVVRYAWHSLLVGVGTVATNCIFATLAGYALGCMNFRFKKTIFIIFMSTLLLPGEVTLTSQYLTIRSLGVDNSLIGVFLPGAIGAINVLLMATACRAIPKDVLDAATVDGATTFQRIRHIVWPNVRGMVSVVGLFAFIGAWDDFLWPLVVLSDPEKYTLTVGMQYLQSNFGTNPRVVAAGTIIALVPIIILFATMQKHFFKGVEEGGVKG